MLSCCLSPLKMLFLSTARGKVWGSDEVNIEGWKPLKRLPGHESGMIILLFQSSPYSRSPADVTDIAWSPEDRYLASVGLDSQVLIWSGYTLGAPLCIARHLCCFLILEQLSLRTRP
jgi:protein HIRA/HIR1